MTTFEYLATPETVEPRELAYGVLRVREAPIVRHQRVVRDLTIALTGFARARALGEILPAPTDVILDRHANLVVQPDLLFVAAERASIVGDHVDGAPDLVVEVLSPRPRVGNVTEKVGWYAQYGVRECWLVDLTRRQFAVLRMANHLVSERVLCSGRQLIDTPLLPGLALAPEDVLGWW